MIRLNLNEQQLFDMIMAVYAAGADSSPTDVQAAQRREALLEKLHRAFDNKILTAQTETTPGHSGRSSRARIAARANV